MLSAQNCSSFDDVATTFFNVFGYHLNDSSKFSWISSKVWELHAHVGPCDFDKRVTASLQYLFLFIVRS